MQSACFYKYLKKPVELVALAHLVFSFKIMYNEMPLHISGFRKLDNERSQSISKKNPDGKYENDSKRTAGDR